MLEVLGIEPCYARLVMWLLFHRKAGTKVVSGGRSFTEACPTCQKRTRFDEVEVSEKYGVWFVDVVDDAERAFRCSRCGDVFDLKDHSELPPASKPVAALPAKPQVTQADRERVAAKIEDELAELKRKLGK